jgi:hypothetical protein
MCVCPERRAGRKGLLFLKKKKQKDFYPLAPRCTVQARRKRMKVFWFFFSKKNVFLAF